MAYFNPYPYLFVSALLLATVFLPTDTTAAPHEILARTSQNSVFICDPETIDSADKTSIRICLDFRPLKEQFRRESARRFSLRDYRRHQEFYRLDCALKTALLSKTVLFHRKGSKQIPADNMQPEVIIPGTVLDMAATRACPELEELDGEEMEQDAVPASLDPSRSRPGKISREQQTRIGGLLKLTENEPANQKNWVQLGNAYYDAEMAEEAIGAYIQALKLKPDDAEVLNDQGTMYLKLAKTTLALQSFEKALAIAPENLESLYNIGYINAIILNNRENAVSAWKRYLQLDKTSETAKQVLLFMEKYDKDPLDGSRQESITKK